LPQARSTARYPRRARRSDIRSVAFKSYVIFFRYVDDTFEVVNIIEGHRDIEALYRDLQRTEICSAAENVGTPRR
jgi:plasmid stabilization system protein ParE